mmetsp:Transcript_42488/g.106197  ORF Transcript_42488/g.106197 Transcript_42488/m.106197 type:complete len:320 (-) Transcript_42488:1408-2367(-)
MYAYEEDAEHTAKSCVTRISQGKVVEEFLENMAGVAATHGQDLNLLSLWKLDGADDKRPEDGVDLGAHLLLRRNNRRHALLQQRDGPLHLLTILDFAHLHPLLLVNRLLEVLPAVQPLSNLLKLGLSHRHVGLVASLFVLCNGEEPLLDLLHRLQKGNHLSHRGFGEAVDLRAILHGPVPNEPWHEALEGSHLADQAPPDLVVEADLVELLEVPLSGRLPLLLGQRVSVHDDGNRHVEHDKDHDEDKGVVEDGGRDGVDFCKVRVGPGAQHHLHRADEARVEGRELPHLCAKHEVGHELKGDDHQDEHDAKLDNVLAAA